MAPTKQKMPKGNGDSETGKSKTAPSGSGSERELVLGIPDEIETLARVYLDAPVGLAFFDTNCKYRQVNKCFAMIMGLRMEELIGKTVHDVLPEEGATYAEMQLRQVLETREPIMGGTMMSETPAQPGVSRQLDYSINPVLDKDDAIMGMSMVINDVTEQEHLRRLRNATTSIDAVSSLTNRERSVLELAAKKLYNKEIAEQLSISPETVKAHMKRINKKLQVKNRREAVAMMESLNVLKEKEGA